MMKNSTIRVKLTKNQWIRKGLYGVVFIAISITTHSCANSKISRMKEKSYQEWKSYQWNEVKKSKSEDEQAWVIHTRKVKETNFLEYKIEGEIEPLPSECLASFKIELHKEASNTENKKYPTYDIVEETDEGLLTYVVHKEPFFLKNTEMSVRYWFFNNEDGTTGVNWKEAWDECPKEPSRKLNRIETFRGSWSFVQTDSVTRAVNTVSFDLKGMPLFLAEPMVIKFIVKGLESAK